MKNDHPNTLPAEEPTRWAETIADDVFHPGVKVCLRWRDLEAAVEQGAVLPQHAHALWAAWAMPGGPTRLDTTSPSGLSGEAQLPLSEPPYLEKLRQHRSQAQPAASRRFPPWVSHLAAAGAGAFLTVVLLAWL